ncbi:MAG TPA: hypothetical protein DCK87_00315 [Desulfotomaculum sp.]|nr:hypothetical protein [Desulfotomaculum sp.]
MQNLQDVFHGIIKDLPELTPNQLDVLIMEASRIKNEKLKGKHNPLLDIIGIAEKCPEDGARNHNKYIYGR